MSEKKNLEKQVPNNVVAITSAKCQAEACKSKPTKAGFCEEHFVWFKEGLITKEGAKASDFDKKFYHFQNRKQKVA